MCRSRCRRRPYVRTEADRIGFRLVCRSRCRRQGGARQNIWVALATGSKVVGRRPEADRSSLPNVFRWAAICRPPGCVVM